jgi:hypothetical protein
VLACDLRNESWGERDGDVEMRLVGSGETYSTFVQNSQLSFWGFLVGRVGEDAAVE